MSGKGLIFWDCLGGILIGIGGSNLDTTLGFLLMLNGLLVITIAGKLYN